jgi:hypothetical protein
MNIYGVWHLCLSDTVESTACQFRKLEQSGLLAATDLLFVNLVGGPLYEYRTPLLKGMKEKNNILSFRTLNPHDFEYSSLKLIYDLANLGSEHSPIKLQLFSNVQHPFKLYYIHSKGAFVETWADIVTRYKNVRLWRDYMEYFVIEKWGDCIKVLDEYDVCGVEWRTNPLPHFSGNFWWATDNYLGKLPNILDYWSANQFQRIWAEMYIGQSNPRVKDFSNFGYDMYKVPVTKEMYCDKGGN